MTAHTKTYDDFIDAVWAFESDINPERQNWYNDNWTRPVIDSYPKVTHPGRVVRDTKTGNPVSSGPLTIEQLFSAIGLKDLYDPNDPRPDWKKIQASVINYLGFVGFQFQESDLNDLGYYNFPVVSFKGHHYPSHYVDVSNSHWKNNVTRYLETDPSVVKQATVVTDTVNFNDAYFTGKNAINNVRDFKDPAKHILIIKDHFKNKYDGIVAGLADRKKKLSDYLGTSVTWDGLTPPVSPPPGERANKVEISLSGLLAGAHLRGARGVVQLLVDKENPADESGTFILQYVQDYGGYETPFGNIK